MKPLKILICNVQFNSYTGTEIVTRDLALGLLNAGHSPIVYSPQIGEIANELTSANVSVISNLQTLSAPPDIIHGHHHLETLEALLRFPDVPAIFVCHSRLGWYSGPPPGSRIRQYIAVDYYCRDRLIEDHAVPVEAIKVIPNAVDLDRFKIRPPLPQKPRKALVFSNAASPGNYLDSIQDACDRLDISLDVAGLGIGNVTTHPEKILPQYDLVFAKARCALEAMSVGAATILCDWRGLGSMVTAQDAEEMYKWNFGMHLLQRPVTVEAIKGEINRYDPEDAASVTQFIRGKADLGAALTRYLEVYKTVLARPPVSEQNEIRQYALNLNQRVETLEIELASLKQTASSTDQAMLDRHNSHLQIRLLQQHIQYLEETYDSLTKTLAFKYVILPLWDLRQKMIPKGSSVERIYRKMLRLMGVE